jgi:hypothetical protein
MLLTGKSVVEEIKVSAAAGAVLVWRSTLQITTVANDIRTLRHGTIAASYPFQLFIAEFQCLLGLMPEPIRFPHIKPSFLCDRHSSSKVSSTLEFLL